MDLERTGARVKGKLKRLVGGIQRRGGGTGRGGEEDRGRVWQGGPPKVPGSPAPR